LIILLPPDVDNSLRAIEPFCHCLCTLTNSDKQPRVKSHTSQRPYQICFGQTRWCTRVCIGSNSCYADNPTQIVAPTQAAADNREDMTMYTMAPTQLVVVTW